MAAQGPHTGDSVREPLLQRADEEEQGGEPELPPAGFLDIFKHFFVLGWVGFGGPSANVGLFQKTFVEKLKWFSNALFLEVLALCQCMPGPTAGQVSFALGTFKQGTLGGLFSGFLFNYPGAVLLTLIGVGLGDFIIHAPHGGLVSCVIAGLSSMGVALVAAACVGLCNGACKDKVTIALCTLAAAATIMSDSVAVLPVMLSIGAVSTLVFRWNEQIPPKDSMSSIQLGLGPVGGALLFAVFFSMLGFSFFVDSEYAKTRFPYEEFQVLYWFSRFYRVGALVFGGGQVMLPLLMNVVIQYTRVCRQLPDGTQECKMVESPDSWVTTDQFYAGMAAAQSMPGPLFNFACYLGSVMGQRAGINPYLGSFVCWVGIFAPGVMLIFAMLPFWGRFRNAKVYKKMMPGLNSSAVGLVVAAMFKMLLQIHGVSPIPNTSLAIGVVGYAAVMFFKVEAPLAVIGGGVLGAIAWACKST